MQGSQADIVQEDGWWIASKENRKPDGRIEKMLQYNFPDDRQIDRQTDRQIHADRLKRDRLLSWHICQQYLCLQVTYYEERLQDFEMEIGSLKEERRQASQQVNNYISCVETAMISMSNLFSYYTDRPSVSSFIIIIWLSSPEKLYCKFTSILHIILIFIITLAYPLSLSSSSSSGAAWSTSSLPSSSSSS